MKRLAVIPSGTNAWLRVALRWSLILGLLLAGLMFITHMPGISYTGPLHPLSQEEGKIRDRLRTHVSMLASDIGERNMWHYQALKATASYITKIFTNLGYRVEEQTFESRGREVKNLIVELPGITAPEEIIVVGAHYDSVKGSPGANDNGSGIAAVLEIARLLKQARPARTVRFAAFVNEEPPFFYAQEMGSRVYATRSRERGEQIVAMLSLETIGYYADGPGTQQYPPPLSFLYPKEGNFIGFVSNLGSRTLVHKAIASFRQHTKFPSEGLAAPGWITCISLSDHWPFWQAGYKAIMVTDTALFRYPYYHSLQDTPDNIDYSRTARVVKGLARVVMDLAGTSPSSQQTNQSSGASNNL